jgi:hypothetical protein
MLDENGRSALGAAKRIARGAPGVTGVDYGFRYVDGVMTGDAGIRFHVARKISLTELSASAMLPRSIRDVPVDVVEGRYRLHSGDPRLPQSPLAPGLSVGNITTYETGTLGLFVRGGDPSRRYMLSNWHVLAGGADATAGDEISQPGPMHLGPNPARPVAALDRYLALSEQFDAALALLSDEVRIDEALFDLDIRPTSVGDPELGMGLVKSGAVSGVTRGVIDGVEGVYQLDYSSFGYGPLWMQGFRVTRGGGATSATISEAGDSGAAWVDERSSTVIGLHFAGEDDDSPLNDYALVHPIKPILERLSVVLAS